MMEVFFWVAIALLLLIVGYLTGFEHGKEKDFAFKKKQEKHTAEPEVDMLNRQRAARAIQEYRNMMTYDGDEQPDIDTGTIP